jgi:4-diphosphocytidyl-2-C-methyl-D-erythritol kinase
MNQILTLPAPAKLNLFLHITAQRPDGYHELQSIFQLIDLCDWLDFDVSFDDIQVNQVTDIDQQDNIIYKAAHLLKKTTGYSGGCHIRLNKHIPMGAGLGGGSSNAATTLLALNHLWQTGLNLEQLEQLGLQLGADVPVFIWGQNAWAEGVGEQLTSIKLPEIDYIVLKPDCFISTKKLFSQEALTRNTTKTTFAAYQHDPMQFGNNFEAIATRLYPPVAEALAYLNQFGQAHLTGTGACVFLAVSSQQNSKDILQHTPCKAFYTRGLQQSPVHIQLGLI